MTDLTIEQAMNNSLGRGSRLMAHYFRRKMIYLIKELALESNNLDELLAYRKVIDKVLAINPEEYSKEVIDDFLAGANK